MNSDIDNSILILGGGLIGLSIAYEFARNNYKVQIISRNRSEAAGFVAAGMLAPHAEGLEAVSYTHLTLPTNREV